MPLVVKLSFIHLFGCLIFAPARHTHSTPIESINLHVCRARGSSRGHTHALATACSRVEAAHIHHEAAQGGAGPSRATGVFLNILTSVWTRLFRGARAERREPRRDGRGRAAHAPRKPRGRALRARSRGRPRGLGVGHTPHATNASLFLRTLLCT